MKSQLCRDRASKAGLEDRRPLVADTNSAATTTITANDDDFPSSPSRHKIRPILRHITMRRVSIAVALMLSLLLWPRPPKFHPHFSRHLESLKLQSGVDAYDAAFTLALQEVSQNIQDDGRFIAGAGWTQLWTRDTAYALQLSLALLYPQVSENTLKALTETHSNSKSNSFGETWLQDVCGHFGGWPNLSDAIVGAQGAWSLYLATGKLDLLKWATPITLATLKWAEAQVLDVQSGLFKGCSSFMESNSGYPIKYKGDGALVGQTKALSTNLLYYMGYKTAANMTWELQQRTQGISSSNAGTDVVKLNSNANKLRQAIRSRLWMERRGYYSYVEDEKSQRLQQMEGLGGSLALLAPDFERNQTRIERILAKTPRTDKGIPCLWPQFQRHFETFDTSSYYHNGRIWPFVQGYWALAAARHKHVDIFAEELDHLIDLSQVKSANKQKMTFAEFYETDGSFVWGRRRQLWSSAGYLGMILQGLFGIQLEVGGIRFQPVKPSNLNATIVLEKLPYRKAYLTIYVSGYGADVETFSWNGMVAKEAFLPADVVGEQVVRISLKD